MRSHWFKETASSESRELRESNADEVGKLQKELSPKKEASSAEISAKAYDETIRGITSEYGEYLSEDQRVRIDIESEIYKPTVLTPEAYCERFPGSDPNVLGHYDAKGRIYMKEGSTETVTHVATHEALHLTSFNEVDDTSRETRTYRSGIRETTYDESGLREDHNRALNEGITEFYAVKEMERRGDELSIEAVSAYPEALKAASELQDIVGEERIRKAYFGGDTEQLKNEVNRLSYDDETAWERFASNVDIIEYGTDYEQIQAAKRELTLQNAVMLSFKEAEAWTAHEVS
jgi:hypothetical protein